jgi:hypothetical protein
MTGNIVSIRVLGMFYAKSVKEDTMQFGANHIFYTGGYGSAGRLSDSHTHVLLVRVTGHLCAPFSLPRVPANGIRYKSSSSLWPKTIAKHNRKDCELTCIY